MRSTYCFAKVHRDNASMILVFKCVVSITLDGQFTVNTCCYLCVPFLISTLMVRLSSWANMARFEDNEFARSPVKPGGQFRVIFMLMLNFLLACAKRSAPTSGKSGTPTQYRTPLGHSQTPLYFRCQEAAIQHVRSILYFTLISLLPWSCRVDERRSLTSARTASAPST